MQAVVTVTLLILLEWYCELAKDSLGGLLAENLNGNLTQQKVQLWQVLRGLRR